MQFKGTVYWLSFTIILIAFIGLSIFVAHHKIFQTDIAISHYVQQYHTNWLDKVTTSICFFGELPYSLISVVLAAVILFVTQFKREAYFTASILLSGLVILIIKHLVDRPRPTALHVRLVGINRFQSFPSGHVLAYTLFFGFLLVLMYTLKGIPSLVRNLVIVVSIFYIVTIPYARIYLGAHWFTDVVGAFLLGLCLLFPLCYFYFKGKNKSQI